MYIFKKHSILICAVIILVIPACTPSPDSLTISEISYEERPHFRVLTGQLEYYYDIKGGGFSRIIDQDGNDWVGFKMEPWGSYPASAASSFRGLPNLVFGQSDDGAGHPGHDKCTSRVEDGRIITESLSGLWLWTWEFQKDHAILDIIKTDPERSYWFLYEGTPGGSFRPEQSYFGSNQGGPFPGGHDYYTGDVLRDNFRWMYVGNKQSGGCLYMVQPQEDSLKDMISFLGNSKAGLLSDDGMSVFGFGREKNARPLISGPGKFIIGVYPETIASADMHKDISKFIENKYLK